MNLLAGKLYDPATSVNKVTTALLALTALDTTNLRLAFVVPPSGMVYVRMEGSLHGATTFPQIMLGVLEGSTVKGRVRPKSIMGGTALATTLVDVEALFAVTGLTPGASLNWDAAYGVETVVAATGLKYGGPNNTTANDAFGGFAFEIWDPCPLYTPASGTPPTTTVHAKIDAGDTVTNAIKTKVDFLPAVTAGAAGGLFIAGTNAATIVTTSFTTTFTGDLTGAVGSVTGLTSADVGAIKTKTDNLPSDPADASDVAGAFGTVNGTLTTIAGYIDTEIGAIKAKTDLIPAAPAAVGDIPTAIANADALLKRDMSAVTGEASRSPLNALRFNRNGFSISGVIMSVLKEDDATTAYTRTLATDPTALPVVGMS